MNVLIVDDNADNRKIIEILLEEFDDIQTTCANDGQEAIELARKTHYDIIFMDIMMPNVDGIEATKVINSFDKKTMILALSALDDEASKNKMLSCGAEDYMTKPIEAELFLQRVRNYIQIVGLRNRTLDDQDATNLFTTKIYSHRHIFNINSLSSLAELWDYYLNDEGHDIPSLSDCIKMIYAYGQFIIGRNGSFHLTAEENEDNLYLTLSPLKFLSETSIKNTLLKHYSKAIFILHDHILSFRLPKPKAAVQAASNTITTTSYEQSILSKTHFNKFTAQEYVETTPISLMEKVEGLENIEDQLYIELIAIENHPSSESFANLTNDLLNYIEIINELIEFEHFAYALNYLTQFLKGIDIMASSSDDINKLVVMMMNFLDDLRSWRRSIFITQEANDIHYLDSSLLSSCLQIQAIFQKKELQESEDDFELF